MERPLPDDVARPVRAYLATLVPGDEVSDAWHELLADVAYWDERQLLPVLRLAHQVVLQHERVTPEVAALALLDSGIEEPEDVAVVLDTDVATARRWTDQAIASRDQEGAATPPRDPVGSAMPAVTVDDAAPGVTVASPPAPTDGTPADGTAAEAVRIGFDEDEPSIDLEGRHGAGLGTRRAVLAALALAVVVVIVWLLAR